MVGLMPTMPVKAAGSRTEPPPSLPSASGQMPAATAAAEPALDPPGVQVEVPGIAGGREERVVAEAAIAEFGRVGLAEDDRAGGAEPLHGDVVVVRDEVGDRGASRRWS